MPAVFVLGLFLSDSRSLDRHSAPDFRAATTVDVRTDVVLQTPEPLNVVVDGTVDGVRSSGPATWAPGRHEVAAGTQLQFPAGSPVPTVAGSPTTDRDWLQPGSGDAEYQMLAIYSLLIAGALGTMGLPHVLVRFYTNPDGRAARRTTVAVLAMIGGFYIVAVLLGVLARLYTPDLLSTGDTDAAVLLVPTAALGRGLDGVAARRARGGRDRGGVPVDVVRAGREPGRGAVHRRPARPVEGLPAGGGGVGGAADRDGADGGAAGLRADGAAGLRGGGLDLLPAAGAGHLVARAHGARRGRRCAGRRGPVDGRRRC